MGTNTITFSTQPRILSTTVAAPGIVSYYMFSTFHAEFCVYGTFIPILHHHLRFQSPRDLPRLLPRNAFAFAVVSPVTF